MGTLLFLMIAFFTFVAGLGYSTTIWSKTYEGTGDEEADCLIRTSDGGYAMAGSTMISGNSSAYVVKTNANGNMLWDKVLGAYGTFPISIIQTNDDGYAIGCGGFNDDNLWKLDINGTLQWSKSYNATIHCMVQTNDGGYALAGAETRTGAADLDFCLIKTDSSGNVQWSKKYGGDSDDEAFSMIQAADGGYILAGSTSDRSIFWLIKTDATGNTLWTRTSDNDSNFGACTEYARQVIKTNDGGCAVVGFEQDGIYHANALLVKMNSTGYTEWFYNYGGQWDEQTYSVVQTADGGYGLAGFVSAGGVNVAYPYLYAFVAANGDGQQAQFFNTLGPGVAFSIVQASNGGYALAGYTVSDSGKKVILLAITDGTGLPEFPSPVILPILLALTGAFTLLTKSKGRIGQHTNSMSNHVI